ncbi:Peptidoglycan-binding protein ArfA [Actinomadura rubteroloni]|uniref:Peptidoglycan-binding protein ArfA n=1 Tax=Actinomadura rubteroloni TaxID=1926885 RepID=A0A2P4UJ16_9ACTN|nr:OmpA family protein [Actinomadura rubteroloni]POM25055.1 Peptidoglycan-binding protein ArfA [Actinomadura rubteroloni]
MTKLAPRRSTACAAAFTALVLTLSGCGGDAKKPEARPTPGTSGGGTAATVLQTRPFAHNDGPAHVELLALRPSANGTVTARLRLVNDGRGTMTLAGPLADRGSGNKVAGILGMGGVALLDGAAMKMYYPLSTADGTCLCTKVDMQEIGPGRSLDLYAVYPAPQAATVSVFVPLAPPFTGVKVGSGSAPATPGQADPGSAQLGKPVVRTLTGTAEGAEESIDQDGNDTRVRLSTDVLFALNKADLSPRADATLRKVAQQIDASRGTEVKIDGYTDNSGNDAINDPLSRARAEAVQNRLKSLVTRQGVTFAAAGHGSADPVADNGSDEGRRKNRRVAVTFARPPAPAASAPPAPSGTPVASARPSFTGPNSLIMKANNLTFTVDSLRRDSGGLAVLTWSITNESGEQQYLAGLGKYSSLQYSAPGTTGARLLDPAGKMRYWPVMDSAATCLCTQTAIRFNAYLDPHETVTLTDVYATPPEVRSVDVELPWFEFAVPVKGVAVSG